VASSRPVLLLDKRFSDKGADEKAGILDGVGYNVRHSISGSIKETNNELN